MIGLVAPTARAFCREATGTPAPGYDPTTQGCFGPNLMPLYWKNLCVGYSLQRDASPLRGISIDQATAVAAQAFATWSATACSGGGMPSVTAVDNGPVDCDLVQYNKDQPNQHVIVFRDAGWPYDDSSNVLGLTTLTYDVTDGEIFDADMEINSNQYNLVAGGPASPGSYDLPSVLTHEAGHFLGLAHSADDTAVMYALYRPGTVTLMPDDIAGICTIDPPDGTRSAAAGVLASTACDPTPRHGFSTQCAADVDAGDGSPASGGDGGANGSGDGAPSGQHPASHAKACSVTAAGATQEMCGPVPLGILATVGFFLRRARRRVRTMRSIAAATALGLATLGACTLATRDARASVSIAVLFGELVRDSSGIAIVTPVEQRAAWEGGRIYTYTRVDVETLVAGTLPAEVWVQTMGGVVGDIGQIVEGEAVLTLGQRSLLFLHQPTTPPAAKPAVAVGAMFRVTARAQGQFPVVLGEDKKPRFVAATGLGALLPPPPERIARIAQADPTGNGQRFARDALHGRAVQEAAPDIAATWWRLNATK